METSKTPTLSDRLEALFVKIKIKPPLFLSERPYCVICGLPRFDPDVTGITCGSERCYRELGENFDQSRKENIERIKLTEILVKISKSLGLDINKDIEALLDDITIEIENIQFAIETMEKSQSKKAD